MKRKINYSELLLSGIYFLISEGEVVYVGETDCIARRIGEHNGNKTFDNFNFFGWIQKSIGNMQRPNVFVSSSQSIIKINIIIMLHFIVLNLALTLIAIGLMVL